jgi:hypothetical protein|nr:MAG TPA: hypothetical protein [Caudoviricetes sp.]
MKKSELGTLIIGSQIENKKNGEVFTINNITEIDSKVKYQLSNDKTITASSMLRWYNLVQPETVEQVELPIAPVETIEPETEQPTTEVETVEPDTVEKEKIEQLIDEEVNSVKLTPLETEALWILKTNEYGNCFDRSDGIASTWDFVVTENISCGIQGAKGVLGSLVRKGLVIIDTEGEYNTSSKQYDHSISLTDLGYKVGLKALETFNPDNIKPVEPKQVNVNTSNDLANEIFDYFTTQQNTFTLKHNTDHSVIKLGRKKLVEIYVSNTEVTVAVRQELYSEDEQANLDNSRIVKDYAFTLKFKVHSLDEFKAVVNRASIYVPVKK